MQFAWLFATAAFRAWGGAPKGRFSWFPGGIPKVQKHADLVDVENAAK